MKMLLKAGSAMAILIASPSHGQEPSVETTLRQKAARLERRDPVKEAADAAARADFRLAATNFIGPSPAGWDLPGVECRMWTRNAIGKWFVGDDVVGPGEDRHAGVAIRYLTRYNQALVGHPDFLYPDLCAKSGGQMKPRYAGAVRSFADAARSADPASLDKVPTGANIDARDPLGFTALQWALHRQDGEMARFLVDRGANVTLRSPISTGAFDGPTPLSMALKLRNAALTDRMLARGATFVGGTGLCAHARDPEAFGKPECSWIGLVIEAGRYDLIDRAGENQSAATSDEVYDAFRRAVTAKNDAIAQRLIPVLRVANPVTMIDWLLKAGRGDLVRAYIALHPNDLGRSVAESRLWFAVSEAGRYEVLVFLDAYGGELNLLPKARLETCRTAASTGDLTTLVSCLRDAADRRARLEALVRAGDTPGLLSLMREAADMRERRRGTVVDLVAQFGTPAMLQAIAPFVAPFRLDDHRAQRVDEYPDGRFPALQGWTGLAALKARMDSSLRPLSLAVERGDPAMIATFAALKPTGVTPTLTSLLARNEKPLEMMPFEDTTTETLPNAPDAATMAMVRPLIALAASADGAQSLGEGLDSALRMGWNDVVRLIFSAGFDPKKIAVPGKTWNAWSGLQTACKPSTGRLLVESGLPMDYPADPTWGGYLPIWFVAVACKNPASATVLVNAGADVNATEYQGGDTALDVALSRRRPLMAQALRRLGGIPGKEMTGRRALDRDRVSAETDWDLVPNGRVR